MAKAAGLDATGKRLTNHSVRKTTVQKLQKQGIPNSHIAAITGHRNEQSLQQYAEMEQHSHAQISKVRSSDPQHVHSKFPLHEHTMNTQATPPSQMASHSSVPQQYYFSNCTVYFGNTQATNTSTQYQAHVETSRKHRRVYVIDSDEESM